MPYSGHVLTTEALNAYAGPVVEQSINQLVQVTPLEQVNERIHEITELVRGHLQDFLATYGVTLNDVKVLMRPRDERMRELISLRAFGLSELDAVRYYVAMKMAERGLVSAPNMAVGEPFHIGLTGGFGIPRQWQRGPAQRRGARGPHGGLSGMSETLGNRLRGLLASDVYTEKGRLRSDDLLIRERVAHGLGGGVGPAPGADQRLAPGPGAAVDPGAARSPRPRSWSPSARPSAWSRPSRTAGSAVRGLPLLNADRVWNRVRHVGLDELMQFDWTLVGEADGLVADLSGSVRAWTRSTWRRARRGCAPSAR